MSSLCGRNPNGAFQRVQRYADARSPDKTDHSAFQGVKMGILYEKRERVAYITINRPEARNAIQPIEAG